MKKLNNLFKRNNAPKKTENDRVIVPTYSSNSTITTPSYVSGEILDRLEETFDEECVTFIKKAEKMDADNGAYMDQRVDSVVEEAIKELNKEYAEHRRLILLPLEEMHDGDKIFSYEMLRECEEELESLKSKLEIYKKVYNKGTAFECV